MILSAVAFAGFGAVSVGAQSEAPAPNTEFQISEISVEYVSTPEYNYSLGPKGKRSKNQNWLELEVTFDWQPRGRDNPEYLDEVTFNYYVLLDARTKENPEGVLLAGEVSHVSIPQKKGMFSVMYVAPRTIERFFKGKQPSTARAAVRDVGVTISHAGQVVAESSWQGRGQWWKELSAVDGLVLNKNETPFAPILWDYYEPIKASGTR